MTTDNERAEMGKKIGRNIRRLRDETELPQRLFAERLQESGLTAWSQARLSNAETANQPLNTVYELCVLAGIFSKLLGRRVTLDEFVQ